MAAATKTRKPPKAAVKKKAKPVDVSVVQKKEHEDLRQQAADLIPKKYILIRIATTSFGLTRKVSDEQKAAMASVHEAEVDEISAGKKLLNSKDPAILAITSLFGRVRKFTEGMTHPWIEPGERLLKFEFIEAFEKQIESFKAELEVLLDALEPRYQELVAYQQKRLGRLFDPDDYPASIRDRYSITCYPRDMNPPPELAGLSPQRYEQAMRNFEQQLGDTVKKIECEFAEGFKELVFNLADALSGIKDGKPKIFRDSTVDNLKDFFEKFRFLNVGSNPDLTALIEKAQDLVAGKSADELRDPAGPRLQIATALKQIAGQAASLTIERPRRNVLMGASSNGNGHA